MHLSVEVTDSSTNKQHHLSVLIIAVPIVLQETTFIIVCSRGETNFFFWPDPIAGYPKFTFCHGVRIRANLAAEESLGPRNSARDFERCDISALLCESLAERGFTTYRKCFRGITLCQITHSQHGLPRCRSRDQEVVYGHRESV